MLTRMIRAARLDSQFYEMVETDPSYMREAVLVVLVAAAASAVGQAIHQPLTLPMILGPIIGIFIFWFIWAGLTLLIGTHVTRQPETQSDMGEMLRVLGYALVPLTLNIFAFLPFKIGLFVQTIAFVWCVVTGVVAVRQALDFSTRRAVVTVFLAALVAYGAQWLATNVHELIYN
jgi:hypothetical protein